MAYTVLCLCQSWKSIKHLNIKKDSVLVLWEQLKLKEESDYLRRRLDQIQSRFGDIASAKTDLSSRLIGSEEEKLKVPSRNQSLAHHVACWTVFYTVIKKEWLFPLIGCVQGLFLSVRYPYRTMPEGRLNAP